MFAALLCLLLPAASGATAAERRIGWWWDAPASADDPTVDNLIQWTANHTDIVSSVLMRCGPTTINGTVAGGLLPSCVKAIPALEALGVKSELWLGETDSADAALKLFNTTEATVAVLAALGRAHPGISGFNFDLEVGGSAWCNHHETSCSTLYAQFLSDVKSGLKKAAPLHQWRVTVDAQCSAKPGGGVTTNCAELAKGADLFMNMDTYNSASYEDWMRALGPSIAPGVPRSQLGAGLGCWIEHDHASQTNRIHSGRRLQPVPAWSLSAESAEQRICVRASTIGILDNMWWTVKPEACVCSCPPRLSITDLEKHFAELCMAGTDEPLGCRDRHVPTESFFRPKQGPLAR